MLPIADRHNDYARDVASRQHEAGIRADVDERTESIGKKIRDGELHKVPYMLIVGDEEQAQSEVAVRRHREGDLGKTPIGDFVASLSAAILARE